MLEFFFKFFQTKNFDLRAEYASYPILSSRASLMLLTYLICTTGPFLPSTGLTSDFAAIDT